MVRGLNQPKYTVHTVVILQCQKKKVDGRSTEEKNEVIILVMNHHPSHSIFLFTRNMCLFTRNLPGIYFLFESTKVSEKMNDNQDTVYLIVDSNTWLKN